VLDAEVEVEGAEVALPAALASSSEVELEPSSLVVVGLTDHEVE